MILCKELYIHIIYLPLISANAEFYIHQTPNCMQMPVHIPKFKVFLYMYAVEKSLLCYLVLDTIMD